MSERIYLCGGMRNIPHFNFPAFIEAAARLRAQGHEVFSPAERDLKRDAVSVQSATGDLAEAEAKGFSLRDALADDTHWICIHATALALLPGWENSAGAFAEWALARALGLKVMYL